MQNFWFAIFFFFFLLKCAPSSSLSYTSAGTLSRRHLYDYESPLISPTNPPFFPLDSSLRHRLVHRLHKDSTRSQQEMRETATRDALAKSIEKEVTRDLSFTTGVHHKLHVPWTSRKPIARPLRVMKP